MKLQQFTIQYKELQDYLDKYQDKIKFIMSYPSYVTLDTAEPNTFVLVIDVS